MTDMKSYWLIIGGLLGTASAMGGCASQSNSPAQAPAEQAIAWEAVCPEPRPVASALVFDPPVTLRDVAPDLSREARERGAFVGFEDQQTTFFYIRIDDRQTGDDRERYERRSRIDRVGAIYR